ncbi:hypothetical protein GCM10010266_70770 [Streptomyces griseomycini]|nr:hypothetical protein GCM10010266_70770 [Streptomyces griseomycini]
MVGVIETGESETGVVEVIRDMTRTGTSSDSDTWLAFDGEGRLVVYALVCDTYGTGRLDVDHYVLPECRQAGAVLLDLMGDRAGAVARANGAQEMTAHLYLSERTTLNTSLLRERGRLPVRRYGVLTKSVAPAPAPRPPPPPPRSECHVVSLRARRNPSCLHAQELGDTSGSVVAAARMRTSHTAVEARRAGRRRPSKQCRGRGGNHR